MSLAFLRHMLFFACVSIVHAQAMFMMPNNSPYLKITPHLPGYEIPSIGPTDFTVIDGLLAVLDSDHHGLVFFDKKGGFVKRIELPPGYYERIVRDRDGALILFADTGNAATKLLRIKEGVMVQREVDVTIDNLVSRLLVDDLGLFFEVRDEFDLKKLVNFKQAVASAEPFNVRKLFKPLQRLRIERDCFQCESVVSKGAEVQGHVYHISYGDDRGNKPSLFIDNHQTMLDQIHKQGGTRIEQIDSSGTVWVKESIIDDHDTILTYLLKIDISGTLQAIYQLPPSNPDNYVRHNVAISDDGVVYVMEGRSEGVYLEKVSPLSALQLKTYLESQNKMGVRSKEQSIGVENNPGQERTVQTNCQSRADIFTRVASYLSSSHCLSDSSIHNDSGCPGRRIPPYLVNEKTRCFLSVSYNWGGFDSLDSFKEKIVHMKAGNVNTSLSPLTFCAAGVDCSGFISQVWHLPVKWGTAMIYQKTHPVTLDDMKTGDIFVKPNNHVLMFSTRTHDEISVFESTVRPGKVISSKHNLAWFKEQGYFLRRAFNVCGE